MNQAAKDIERHFRDKLDTLMTDTLDTFDRGGVCAGEALAAVIAVLGYQLAFLTIAVEVDEDHFVTVIRDCFRKVRERERKALEQIASQ